MTAETERAAARLTAAGRDYRGRFLRKVKMTPDGSREWLIWSKYHHAWHRRSSTGGACGYTSDIAEAGIFDRAKAVSYNSDRDTPKHVSEVSEKIARSIAEHEAKIASLNAVRAHIAKEEGA